MASKKTTSKPTAPAKKETEDYGTYLRAWIEARRQRVNEASDDPSNPDPDLYVNMDNNAIVRISDLVLEGEEFNDDEIQSIGELSDVDSKCDEHCKSIKQKLANAGYELFVSARLVGRAPGPSQLLTAIRARQNIDRFIPRATKTLPVKSVLAPSSEKKAELDLDRTFEKNHERVVELIKESSEDEPVYINLVTATTTPLQPTRGIRELVQNEVPSVHFTYAESLGYPLASLKVLMERYIEAYKEDVGVAAANTKAKGKATKKPKSPTKPSKPSAKTSGETGLEAALSTLSITKPSASAVNKAAPITKPASKVATVVPPQPKQKPTAVRTVGGAAVPLRLPSGKPSAPNIAAAASRKPVGATSALIVTLDGFMKRRQQKASSTIKSGLKTIETAPEATTKAIPAPSKTSKSVTLQIKKPAAAKTPAKPVEVEAEEEEEEEEPEVEGEEQEEEGGEEEAEAEEEAEGEEAEEAEGSAEEEEAEGDEEEAE